MEAAQMGAEHEQEAQHKEDLHRVATKASFLRLMMWQNSIRERLAAMGKSALVPCSRNTFLFICDFFFFWLLRYS